MNRFVTLKLKTSSPFRQMNPLTVRLVVNTTINNSESLTFSQNEHVFSAD